MSDYEEEISLINKALAIIKKNNADEAIQYLIDVIDLLEYRDKWGIYYEPDAW